MSLLLRVSVVSQRCLEKVFERNRFEGLTSRAEANSFSAVCGTAEAVPSPKAVEIFFCKRAGRQVKTCAPKRNDGEETQTTQAELGWGTLVYD